MAHTRSAAKRINPEKAHSDNGMLKEDTTVEPVPEKNAPSLAKKRGRDRREDGASPKKRRRGKPGELCQLNLDVLFLVR